MWATCNSYIVIRSSSTFQFLHGIIICFHVHIHAIRDSEQSSSRWTTDVPCCWTLVVSSSFYFVRPEMLVTVIARPSSSDQKRRTETIPLFMWDNALPHQDNRSDYWLVLSLPRWRSSHSNTQCLSWCRITIPKIMLKEWKTTIGSIEYDGSFLWKGSVIIYVLHSVRCNPILYCEPILFMLPDRLASVL